MYYLKKEFTVILAVLITIVIVGISLFSPKESSSTVRGNGENVISPVGQQGRARCEIPFREKKVEPRTDIELNQNNLKTITQ